MSRAAVATLLLGLAVAGCRREEAPPEDRTLARLRAEVDRANAGGAVIGAPNQTQDPNANLAALAVGAAEGGSEGPWTLPPDGVRAQLGPIALRLVAASTSHQVQSAKMSLTSEELFLQVKLGAHNAGSEPVPFSIEQATVSAGDRSWPLARDALFLISTRKVGFDLAPGESRELLLVFEVPVAGVKAPTLELALPQPAGGNGDVRLRLK